MHFIENLKKVKYIIVVFVVWIVFALPFFFGKTPYPADYQVNFFQPWVQYPLEKGPVKNNAQPDIIGQIYPWRHYSIEELKQGRLPLWNPYSFSGTPHIANYQSATFSIYNVLFFLPLSFLTVWGFLIVLQPLLAGIFTYMFSRSLGISEKGSVQASVSFMFCGFIVTWLGYGTLAYAILPIPLALFSIERYVKTNNFWYGILLSFTVPLSFFSGHFQTSIYFLGTIILYILFLAAFSKRKYLSLLYYVGCGVLLSMPQLLPSIEFYSNTVRSSLFQKFEAIPWGYIPTLIAPDFYGNPVTRNDWFGHYAEWNGYAGAVSLFLSFFAILLIKKRIVLFFIILAILSLLLAFDSPVLNLMVSLKIPVLSTSAASRAIVLFSFSVAILSGFGFDHLMRLIKKDRKKIISVILFTLAIVVSIAAIPFLNFFEQDKELIAIKNMILPLGILSVAIVIIILLHFLKNKKIVLYLGLILILITIFEMLRFSTKWQSFTKTSLVYSSVPITRYYNSHNHYDRALGLSSAEDALYYRVPIPNGYDPLYIGSYGEFVRFLEKGEKQQPERSVVNFPLSGKYTPQAINFLGVKSIVHKVSDGNFPWAFPFEKYPPEQFTKIYDDGIYNVFKNNSSLDKAFLVGKVSVLGKDKILQEMFSQDLSKVAFVSDEMIIHGTGSGSVDVKSYHPGRIEFDVNSQGENMLVLTDNYYPGWKAYVNGNLKRIYKTNYTFRGVIVPDGYSKVIFEYKPNSFMYGIYMFGIGFLGIIMIAVLKRIK